MEMILTLAQSGLGTAETFLKRKAAKEKDAAKKRKLQKVAAALRVSNDAISELLADEALSG
jgi:hypothetical protein